MGFLDIPFQVFSTIHTNKTNESMNESNIAMQERQNELNRQLQEKWNQKNLEQTEKWNTINQQNWQSNFDYQKALQQQIFDREDSSYQRTVNDMRSAGISPLVMNGTNGAGQALQTTPFQGTPYNSAIAPQGIAPQNHFAMDYSGLGNMNLSDVLSFGQNYRIAEENIRSQKIDNDMKEDTYEMSLLGQRLELINKIYNSLDSARKNEWNRFYGIHSGMTPEERNMQIYSRAFNLGDDEGIQSDILPFPLKIHGKYDEYWNGIKDYYLGDSTYYINPDTYAKFRTGKDMLKSGLDYASQFLKFYKLFNKKIQPKKNNINGKSLDWLPF